jgi:hypothetical protein
VNWKEKTQKMFGKLENLNLDHFHCNENLIRFFLWEFDGLLMVLEIWSF